MIALYILVALIAIIFLLLLSSVCVRFSFDDKFYLRVSILGVILFSYDSSKPIKPSKEKAADGGKNREKTKFKDSVKHYAKSKNIFKLISDIFPIVLVVLKKIKTAVYRLKFYNMNFNLTVATDDAAQTAILYGKMCSVIAPVVVLLSENLNFDCECVSVTTDFLSDNTVLKASGTVKLRLIHIVSLILSSVWAIIKIKIGEVKYVRK